MNKKQKIATVVWFFLVMFIALTIFGCATNKPSFEPLPPAKLYDLLHSDEHFAYKSVTKKDYECKEEC